MEQNTEKAKELYFSTMVHHVNNSFLLGGHISEHWFTIEIIKIFCYRSTHQFEEADCKGPFHVGKYIRIAILMYQLKDLEAGYISDTTFS